MKATKCSLIFLCVILGITLVAGAAFGQSNFSDIEGHWAQKDIEQLSEWGIVSGYEDGTFKPEEEITRAEMSSMMRRAIFHVEDKIQASQPTIDKKEIKDIIVQAIKNDNVVKNKIKGIAKDEYIKQSQAKTNKLLNTIDETRQSVVLIKAGDNIGSGAFIKEDIVLTCAHVVGDNTHIDIKSVGNKTEQGKVIAKNKKKDLALVKVDLDVEPLEIAEEGSVKGGQVVYAYGNPLGVLKDTVTQGIVSKADRVFARNHYVQVDVPINPGNSGGVCCNKDGEIIGVSALRFVGSGGVYPGLALAVGLPEIYEFLDNNNQGI